MGSNDTSFLESSEEQLEVWLLEQALGRSLWVGRVGDNDIELVLVIVQELESISNVDLDLGVLVADGHSWEVFLGKTDDGLKVLATCIPVCSLSYLINVAQNSLLNTLMLDDLSQNTSISTTNNQNLLWRWVGVHGQVGDHLLVCELVTLSALDDIVEDEDGSVVGGLEDEDVLILTLLVVEDVLDLQGHSLARPHVGDLAKPAICEEDVSNCLEVSQARAMSAASS